MTHIDEVEAIIESITSYVVVQTKITPTTGVYLQPSKTYGDIEYLDTEFFDLVVVEDTLALLQTKKKALLRCSVSLDFAYTDYASTYPFYLKARLIRYDYDVDFNPSAVGKFLCWIQFEARWAL